MGFMDFLFGTKPKTDQKNNAQKGRNKKGALPKTVQQSIPYTHIFANGVIETKPGCFTMSYKLSDVNFKIAPDQEQMDIFKAYQAFLNSFPANIKFSILIQNHATDTRETLNVVRFQSQRDGLNRFRSEMNGIMAERIGESRNNLTTDKYLIVSIEDDDAPHAMQMLNSLTIEIDKALRRITKEIETIPMSITERLELLYRIYNQDDRNAFANWMDDDGNRVFDIDRVRKLGLTTKDIIGPSGMEFKPGYFRLGEFYGRSLYLSELPVWLKTEFLADLSNVACAMNISIYHQPVDTTRGTKMVRDQIVNINAQVAQHQKQAAKEGISFELLPDELERSRKQANSLMDDIVGRDQKLFFLTFVITIFAETREDLEQYTKLVSAVADSHVCKVKTLSYQQEAGLNASLPLCVNNLEIKRLYTTESAAIYIPYTSQELFQKNGLYYGLNQTTNSMIVYSRMSGRNYNGLIFGESGTGKSFTAKCEMMSVLLRNTNSQVYVIDPEGEYAPLAEALDGEVIELSTASKKFVNPLDMDIDYGGDNDPVAMKSDFIISMIEIMHGSNAVLTPRMRSIIDRCVRNIYRGYLQHMDAIREAGNPMTCDKAAMPTLNNLYEELRRQEGEEAHMIANTIEIYAQGSLATFSHRTNVETSKKFVVYDVSKLGTGMKNLGLHICLNDIWNKMIENRKKDIWTWFYIDEFYLLLQSDSAARFLMQIWKRARKWNGVPTGIMQNTEDLLRSADSRQIINNTSFVTMLSLPKLDRLNLGDLLQIPDSQLEYITNKRPGYGLIYNGKTVLPFKNEFPKGSPIYKALSTSGSKDRLNA